MVAALSGGLMTLCYWPRHLHMLAWVAMVPWLTLLPALKPTQVKLFGTVVGLVFYRITLGWLFELSGLHAAFVILVFSLLFGYSFYVARLVIKRLGTSAMLWVVPLCFTGQEILRSETLSRFRLSYAGWGYSQAGNLWIAQIASLGGVYFITFLITACNAAIAYGLIKGSLRYYRPFGVIATCILIMAILAQPSDYNSHNQIPAACVQIESTYYREHRDLTEQALKDPLKPVFIVLPEHAINDVIYEKHYLIRSLKELAQKHNAYICVGAHDRAPKGADCNFDNVAILIGPGGRIIAQQAKAVPVPFFIDGNPARNHTIADTQYGKVGMYVCYDGSFTDIPRKLAALGAELILGPVMNPEEWPVAQRRQQADMARFRSIELRRCVVRTASSGISQIIDATGNIRNQRTREDGPGVLCGKVYLVDKKTLFVRGGYMFSHIIVWVFIIITIIMICVELLIGCKRIIRRFRIKQ